MNFEGSDIQTIAHSMSLHACHFVQGWGGSSGDLCIFSPQAGLAKRLFWVPHQPAEPERTPPQYLLAL